MTLDRRVIDLYNEYVHSSLPRREFMTRLASIAGSGVFVINPPFTLHDELLKVLPYLTDTLGQYDGANFLLEQRAA